MNKSFMPGKVWYWFKAKITNLAGEVDFWMLVLKMLIQLLFGLESYAGTIRTSEPLRGIKTVLLDCVARLNYGFHSAARAEPLIKPYNAAAHRAANPPRNAILYPWILTWSASEWLTRWADENTIKQTNQVWSFTHRTLLWRDLGRWGFLVLFPCDGWSWCSWSWNLHYFLSLCGR